jgi:Rod binding domain-containing protein
MSVDLSSLGSFTSIPPLDLSAGVNGASDATRIKQVSKAMESLFVSQLTEEMGKGIDSSSDSKEQGGMYSDFIHQAMTQGVTQGGGFGLAKVIENYLDHRNAPVAPHQELKTNNKSYHVKRAD